MTSNLQSWAAQLAALIECKVIPDHTFDRVACALFAFQFEHNAALRRICEQRGLRSGAVDTWRAIPAVPVSAFKHMEMTLVPPDERIAVFHSSGTTGRESSRHFHSRESLGVYEVSLLNGFGAHLAQDAGMGAMPDRLVPVFLTPPPEAAPHSSLVHMLGTIGRARGFSNDIFCGTTTSGGDWCVDHERLARRLHCTDPLLLFGTAFQFVHLIDEWERLSFRGALPEGTRLIETGGYKGRSREMPMETLHAAISTRLGVPRCRIAREFGMCELSSQAYDRGREGNRVLQFPPWVRAQICSPETGREMKAGEVGLLCVCDLANLSSTVLVQTEDLARSVEDGFELCGRAAAGPPRGCSLMTA